MGTIVRGMGFAAATMLAACAVVDAHESLVSASPDGLAAIDELQSLLPAGAEVLASSTGDIDGDLRPDMVVAVDLDPRAGGDTPRSLLLFVRDTEGQLQLGARNDIIVPCAECGGSLGPPSILLDSGSSHFILRTEGGTGWLWSNEYAFRYSGNGRWQLESVREVASSRTSEETTSTRRTAQDFGSVDFVKFDPHAIGVETPSEE
jgi:hypothetical protein